MADDQEQLNAERITAPLELPKAQEPNAPLKVKIIRKADIEPVVALPYIDRDAPDTYSHWQSPAEESVFEVSVEIATAAVATGAFEVTSDSRIKLK